MIVKVALGLGRPGKLWTGSELEAGMYARVELVEFRSPMSSASTRRLFVRERFATAPEGIIIPTLHVATGGVGSITARLVAREGYELKVTPSEEEWLAPLLTWNWSGRVGGHVIVDPVRVETHGGLNKPLPGYRWLQTYSGLSRPEDVLVKMNDVDPNRVDDQHILPVTRKVELLSPPEREVRAATVSALSPSPVEALGRPGRGVRHGRPGGWPGRRPPPADPVEE